MKKTRIMMLKVLICLISILSLFTTSSCIKEAPKLDSSTFDDFTNSIFYTLVGGDELTVNYLFEHPEDFGLEHYEPSLPKPGVASAEGKVTINLYFGQIERYDYDQLSEDQQMTYNIIVDLLEDINAKTSEMSYLSNNYLGSYLGYQAQLPLLLSEYKFRTKLDIENYFKFLDLVPETFKSYVDFEIEKTEKGYGMPDFVIDKVVTQCANFISKASSSEHFMITTVNKKIDSLTYLTVEEKTNYKIINEEKVKGPLIEGYRYVLEELPKIKNIPGRKVNELGLAHQLSTTGEEIGKKYYEIDFQDTVGYRITMDEAIKYIEDKIASYKEKLTYYQNLYATNTTFRNEVLNYQLMNTSPEVQLEYYKTAFNDYFPTLPAMPNINVKYIDEAMEDNFSPAAYMTSAIDNYTEEFIYLNNADVRDENGVFDYNYLYSTLAHEGLPGHMYQNIYFKNQDVNVLRKVLKSSGYSEGWATYAEIFSYELLRGSYSDEFIDYLIFNDEYNGLMHSRLDMGIHYDGWTLEQTKEFIHSFAPNASNEAILATFQQLIEVPNNVQTYYFTYFKLKDLRTKVMDIAGSNFDYKEFHTYILNCGPAPLRFVEEYVLSKY